VADVVLLGFFAFFILGGWRTGFVRRLAGLIFLAASFVLGAYFRGPIGAVVASVFPDMPREYADMVGYSVAFTVLVAGFNLFSGAILSKVAVQGLSAVPDKVLGAVLGAVEAALIASAAIVILHTYSAEVASLTKDAGLGVLKDIADGIDSSTIGKLLTNTTVPFVLAVLGPLLPSDITSLVPKTIPGLPGGTLPGLR
jgi:uncharacterized membrane protein required for colicin V production